MKPQKQEIYANHNLKQSRYDKHQILKIMQDVENGLPRNETVEIF